MKKEDVIKMVEKSGRYHYAPKATLKDVVNFTYKGMNPYDGLDDTKVVIFKGTAKGGKGLPESEYFFAVILDGNKFTVTAFAYITANLSRNDANRERSDKAKVINLTEEEYLATFKAGLKKAGVTATAVMIEEAKKLYLLRGK